jgi:uncharacterized protein (TIGR00266 family)
MSTIQHQIEFQPDFATLRVQLAAGQSVYAEPSAMATMSTNIKLVSSMRGGLGAAVSRAFSGESFVMNTFTAEGAPGEVWFAPGPMGDMRHVELHGNRIVLQRGAFVACSEGVEVKAKWEGLKGFFSGEGFVLQQATGTGDLWFNTFGAILEIDVLGEYIVDTGCIVAFEDTLSYQVTTMPRPAGGGMLKTFLFGGEGLVCRFSGVGRLWIQTRGIGPFLGWVHPFRPVEKKN